MKKFGHRLHLKKQAPDTSKLVPMSDWNKSGWDEYPEILNSIWEEVNKLYGTDAKPKI